MYKEHFGLDKALFSDGIVRDGDVFFGPRQQLVAANLKIALSTRDSVTVLSGPMGVGKTTLASHAVRAATTRLALGWLGSAPLTPHELLEHLLSEFDLSPYKSSRVERLQNWRQFLGEMSITDTRVCVLVENAQELEPEIVRHLGALTSADPNGCPGANIVLTCPTMPRELLNAPGLEPIKQRVRLSCRLEPLGAADVKAYLSHRAELAGSSFDKIFAADTDRMLHHYSEGIFRVVNNLCESALTVAATRKEALLTPDLVMRVAVGLFGMEPTEGLTAKSQPKPHTQDSVATPTQASVDQLHSAAPIVGAAAIAAARMMAEEADVAANAEQAESSRDHQRAAPAVSGLGEPTRNEDSAVEEVSAPQAASTSPADSGGDAHAASDSVPRLLEDLAADDDLIEDIAAESLRIKIASIPIPAPTEFATAPETLENIADEPVNSASIIEFVTEDDSADPFEFDEQTITDAVAEPAVVDDLDLPILTDSVEPETGDRGVARQPAASAEVEAQKHDAMEAFAHAKALEDISNSMAETLFGEAELAHLGATLAVASGESDVDDDLSLEFDDEMPPARSHAL